MEATSFIIFFIIFLVLPSLAQVDRFEGSMDYGCAEFLQLRGLEHLYFYFFFLRLPAPWMSFLFGCAMLNSAFGSRCAVLQVFLHWMDSRSNFLVDS